MAHKNYSGPGSAAVVKRKLSAALAKAEITINLVTSDFHAIATSGTIGNAHVHPGTLTEQYMGNRTAKENAVFGTTDVPAADRPKYGAVNWTGRRVGAAPEYGAGVIVLNKKALAGRTTATSMDSLRHSDSSGVATLEEPHAALARNSKALKAAGLAGPGDKGTESYVELQIWGHLPFDKTTVQEVRMPGRHSQRAEVLAFHEFAEKAGIKLSYFDDDGKKMTLEAARERGLKPV